MINKRYPDNESLKEAHRTFPDNMKEGYKFYAAIYSKFFNILFEVPRKSKVLDVGCNSGEISLMLKEMSDCDMTGIDISSELVEKCKSKGIPAICCDAEKIPFEDNTFDCVWLGEMIEHSHEPEKILTEIRRVLKPSGKLVGATLDEGFLEECRALTWDDERLHAKSYTLESMRQLISKYFQDVNVYRNISHNNMISIMFTGKKEK